MPFHKNLYEQIQYETAHGVAVAEPPEEKALWPLLLWNAVPGALLLLFAALRSNRGVMDRVVFGFTTPLKHHLARLNDHIPFAVGELLWAVAIIGAVVFLVRTIWLLLRSDQKLRLLLRRVLGLTAALLFIACSFTLMWGCNYYATSFTQRSELSQRGLTTTELAQLTAAFAAQCSALAPEQDRDSDGTARYDLPDLFSGSAALYEGIEREFPVLAVERHDPKAMLCSKALSLTGFSGFYFPMTAESIVNVDQTPAMIPSTILHELAHQCNVAEEDAANFVAILAGLRCEDVRFQYSSALLGYIHLSNALYDESPELCRAVSEQYISEAVQKDLGANNRYWDDYETPVAQASEQVYEGFLGSYGHSEGMKSYGLCINLLSAYYFGENGLWTKAAEEAAQQEQAAESSAPADRSAEQSAPAEQSPSAEEHAPAEAAADRSAETSAAAASEKSSKTGQKSQKDYKKSSSGSKTTTKDAKTAKKQ